MLPDELNTIQLLEGVMDIYMPDFKFWNKSSAGRYCRAPDYPEKARIAIRQAGLTRLAESPMTRILARLGL